MPINNIEATGAAIAAPGTRPVYTADVVIKDATEAYIECLYDDEDANRALTLDVLAADLTLAVNGKIQEVNNILKDKRAGIKSAKENTTDPAKLLEAPGWALRDLEAATERYERAFTRVAGGAIRYDKENVQGGGSDPDMPLIMVAQRSIELDEAQRAYDTAVEAAEHAIGILPDWRKQFVLTSRYVDTPALTWPQIAEALGLSLRQTYRMSITGTSSKEAATTIQGSIAMMKASWENFLTGLANPDADVGALADQLMESFEAVVTNIAPVAERVLTNLSNFFVNNGPQILEQLISLLNSLAPGLIQAVVTLLLAVAQALVDNIDLVADGLMQLVTGLFQILAQPGVLEGLLNAIITLLGYAANGIIEYGVPLFVKASTLLVEAIVNAFAGAGTWLLEAGFELIAGLMEGISEGLAPLANLLTSVTNMIPEWKGPPERDKNLLRGNGRLIMQSLAKGISDEEGNLEQTLGGVTNTIANGVGTGNVDYGDSAAGGLHNAIAASNRNDNSSPMTIIVQSVLDGRVIGETAYNYNRQIGRALGV